MLRLAVLGSTRGSHLDVLMAAIEQKQLAATIALVASNKKEAPILQKAANYQLPTYFIDPQSLSASTYDDYLSQLLKENQVEMIVLMGYMRILSAAFVNQWQNKIINIHPALLPAYKGLMDLKVHQAILAAGEHYSGCTIHYVTKEVDAGPIILQKHCAVLESDSAISLKERVQALEKLALVEALQSIISALKG